MLLKIKVPKLCKSLRLIKRGTRNDRFKIYENKYEPGFVPATANVGNFNERDDLDSVKQKLQALKASKSKSISLHVWRCADISWFGEESVKVLLEGIASRVVGVTFGNPSFGHDEITVELISQLDRSADSIEAMLGILCHCKEVHLDAYMITPRNAIKIGDGLEKCKNLEKFKIFVGIGNDYTIATLFRNLRNKLKTISTISLSGLQGAIDRAGGKALGEYIANTETLCYVDLSAVNMSTDAWNAILDGCVANKNMQVLRKSNKKDEINYKMFQAMMTRFKNKDLRLLCVDMRLPRCWRTQMNECLRKNTERRFLHEKINDNKFKQNEIPHVVSVLANKYNDSHDDKLVLHDMIRPGGTMYLLEHILAHR